MVLCLVLTSTVPLVFRFSSQRIHLCHRSPSHTDNTSQSLSIWDSLNVRSLRFALFLFYNRQAGPISPLPVSSVVLTVSKLCCAKFSLTLSSGHMTFLFSCEGDELDSSHPTASQNTTAALWKAESTVWDATTVRTHQQYSKWKHKWFVDDASHTSWKTSKKVYNRMVKPWFS